MDAAALEALEFGSLKGLIALHVRTSMGLRALGALAPSPDPRDVRARAALASEAMRRHQEAGRLGPGALDDPEPVLERLRPAGAVLDPPECVRVISLAQAASSLRRDLGAERERWPLIWEAARGLPDLTETIRPMVGMIAEDGRLEDAASAELGRLRRRLAEVEARLSRSLQTILESAAARGLLQDAYVTVRNGRFVIPVKAEARSLVSGIVHGSSSTGATAFVEPMETLEANNEIVTLRDRETAEVRRILAEWSDRLRARLEDLAAAVRLLGALDLLGAVAAFGHAYECRVPVGQGDAVGRLLLEEARHPVLESGLRQRGGSVVPLTVQAGAGGGALVLSGPNAGGKTVALKTIGLLCLMHQSGIPLPVKDAALPVFRQVLADIGDHQSILESLSTFSARMVRVAEIARVLESPALVLLDEVGAGTDPAEAGALAVAIVDHLAGRGALVVTTTHHEELKAWAEAAPGALNASMEIDGTTMRPTFRLVAGVAGRSGGLDLAARVGLPEQVIADARSRLREEHRETRRYLARLHEMAETREREEAEVRSLRARLQAESESQARAMEQELDALRRRWREAVEAALSRLEVEREGFLASLSDRAVALQLRAEARRQAASLRDRIERALAAAPEPAGGPEAAASRPGLLPGDRVRVAGVAEQGVVEGLVGRGRAEVTIRGKRLTVPVADLTPAAGGPPPPGPRPRRPPAGVRLQAADKEGSAAEIILIGVTVEEGLDRLDKFLDDAYLAGHAQVRVVHGHGTGRLRAAVRAMLKGHPHVASHAAAPPREGGEGATVAVLRD